jgi:methyl acetate hydrolase
VTKLHSARVLFVLLPCLFVQVAWTDVLHSAAEIDAFLDRAVAETHVPGLVALVVDGERILYSRVAGHRSVSEDVPMSADTIFNIASMTKPIATTAVMMLVEEGKLSLDDPVSTHVPALRDRPVLVTFDFENASFTTRPAVGEITLRQLLSHSSGLVYGFASDAAAAWSAANPDADAAAFPLLFDPGTGWAYAGGIAIVGSVLEEIEGKTLDVFLQERIFDPLGMNDTAYVVADGKHPRVAAVFRATGEGLEESPVPAEVRSPVSGDGGLYSTAEDYGKFIQMILTGGLAPDGTRLLAADSVRVLAQNHLGSVRVSLQDEPLPLLARAFPLGAGRDGFGLGFQVTGEHAGEFERSPGSLSWAGIFNTQFWIDPVAGIGGVLLMQYLPFYDDDAIATLVGFEERVYQGLR